MKLFAFVLIILLFAACAREPVVLRSVQHIVVMPGEALFTCPAPDLPESRTLTDVQIARLIVQLYRNNVTCNNSMTALRAFLETAQRATQPQP